MVMVALLSHKKFARRRTFLFVPESVSGPLPVFQHIRVFLHTRTHVSYVCSYHLNLAEGYLSASPWSFHCSQLEQCRPSLLSLQSSDSPPAAIFRPKPQLNLCLRHPIISLWSRLWEIVWHLRIEPHPHFLFQWQKQWEGNKSKRGCGCLRGQVVIGLV